MVKSVSPSTFVQGGIATYTLTLQGSEYVAAEGVTITDTLPNGMCPLSSTTSYVTGEPADCAASPGSDPTGATFDEVTQNPDGTFTIRFSDLTIQPDGTATVTYRARMREVYTGGALAGQPTVSGDSFTNSASVTATTVPIPGTGETGGTQVLDSSSVTLTSQGGGLDKTVRARTIGPADCTTGSFVDPAAGDPAFLFRQGDQMCFQLTYSAAASMASRNVVVTDFLPAGTAYVPGSAFTVTSPGVGVAFSDADAAEGTLTWTVGDPRPGSDDLFMPAGSTLRVRFAAVVLSGAAPGEVDVLGNLMKVRAQDSSGQAVSYRDEVTVSIAPAPDVSVRKGVQSIQDDGAGPPRVLDPTPPGSPGSDVDGPQVRQGDVVTFRIDVTNRGEQALGNDNSIRGWQVWDVLPAGITCDDVVPNSPSPTGAAESPRGQCTNPGASGHPTFADRDRRSAITWVASRGIAADADGSRISSNSTRTLTYQVRVPVPSSVGARYVNTASVRSFDVFTNVTGTTSTYFPADNVDTTLSPTDFNAAAASDPSSVVVPDAALLKRVVETGVTEPGNNNLFPGSPVPPAPQAQATNGETVTFRVGVTIPARTTVFAGRLTDPLPAADLTFVSATAAFSPTGTSPATGALPPDFQLSATGDLTFPPTYTNATASPQLVEVVLTARVTPGATPLNSVKQNTATFTRSTAATGGTALPPLTSSGTVQVVFPDPTLRKTNQTTPPVNAGNVVRYTLRISNAAGRPPLHDAVVVDCLPAGMAFRQFSPVPPAPATTSSAPGTGTGAGGNGCAVGSTRIEWRPGVSVPAGGPVSATYEAVVGDAPVGGVTYTNTATLTGSSLLTGGNTPSTERVITRTSSSSVAVAVPTVTKTATPARATFGQRTTFRVTARLPQEIALFDAAVVDELPAGFDPASVITVTASCARDDGNPCVIGPIVQLPNAPSAQANGSRRIGWSLGDSPVTASDEVVTIVYSALLSSATAPASVDRADVLSNRAFVAWDTTDGGPPPNAGAGFDRSSPGATASVTVTEPVVSVVKTVTDTTPGPADELTYEVRVTNSSEDFVSPGFDLTVVDRVPRGVVVSQVGTGGTLSGADPAAGGGSITWRIPGPLAPGASTSVEYTARLADSPGLDARALTNTVTVEDYASQPEGTAGRRTYPNRDPQASATLTPQFPRVEVAKSTPDGSLAYIDEGFLWQVDVTNTGTAPARGVVLSDRLPPNWRYVSGSFALSVAGGQARNDEPAVETEIVDGSVVQTLRTLTPFELAPGARAVARFRAAPIDQGETSVARDPGVGTSVDHTNTASVTATDGAGFTGNALGSYVVGPATADAQVASADLVTAKTSPGEAVAGERLVWTITVRNAGPDDALRRVTVTDRLPADNRATDPVLVSASGAGYTCQTDRGVITCQRDMTTADGSPRPFAAGATETLTIVVDVPSDVPAGTLYENSARVTSATFDPDTSNNTDTDQVTVNAEADLAITKRVTGPVVAGTVATYALDVRNNGPSTARAGISVVDTMPAGALFRGFTGDGWDCAEDPADARRVICLLDRDLPAGTPAPQLAIRVLVASNQTTDVVNTAEVDSATPDPVPGNDTDTVTTPVQAVADVLLEKESAPPPQFVPGEGAAVYRFRAYNAGPSDAGTLTLTDLLPAGVRFVEVLDPDQGWSCGAQPGTDGRDALSCARAAGLVAEDETVLAIQVALDADLGGGDPTQVVTIRNEASVTSITPDPVTDNNTDDDETTSTREADLVLTKAHQPDPAVAGGNLTFTLALTNEGRSTATAPVVVRDRLADAFAFTGFGSTSGWDCRHDGSPSGGLVTCTLGPPGAPVDLAVTEAPPIQVTADVLPSAGPAQVPNVATTDSLTPDPDLPSNVGGDLVTIVDEADVGITKTTTGGDPVRAGETTEFTLEVTNAGPSDADAVSVTDRLPRGLILEAVVAPAPWECSGEGSRDLACTHDAPLEPGDAPAIVVTARVAPDVPDGDVLTNTARVATSSPQGDNVGPDESSDTVAVIARGDLTLTKALVQPDSACEDVCAGEPAAFTLQVTNEGPSTAGPAVRLIDTLPAGVTFVGASDPAGAWQCSADEPGATGQTVACVLVDPATGTAVPLDPVQAGVEGSGRAPLLTLEVVVDAATDVGTLTNEALVTTPTVDPVPGNNEDAADVIVALLVDLGITKTHTGPVRISDPLTFTLEVTNAGPSQAQRVRVRDILPPGLDDPVVQPLDGAAWSCQAGDATDLGTPLDCLLADPLAPGRTAGFTVSVRVGPQAYPTATNVAEVSTSTPEVDRPGELPDTATDTVSVPPQVDLSVVKTHRGQFTVGGTGTFVLTVANAGPTPDPGPVTVTDRVPAGLRPVAAAGDGWECSVSGQTVTCTDADGVGVTERTSIRVTVEVLPQAVPSVTNTATVGSDAEDVQPANNSSEVSVPVRDTPGAGSGEGPGDGAGDGLLPRTGAPVGALVAVALLLLGAGATLLAASRHRTSAGRKATT
jgi:uncharacterized repeat protein (TIGR01451 family)